MSPDLWFGPNVSSDVLELATQPEFWPVAKTHCAAVQLFIQQILTDTDAEAAVNRVGANRWPAIVANEFLGRIGLPVTLEAGGPKPWSCDGIAAADGIARAIQRVHETGAELAAVTLDEPLMSIASYMPNRCTQTAEQLTDPIGRCIRACRDHGVDQVNIVEAYPASQPTAIIAMFDRLQQAGYAPSGLHLDVDAHALGIFGGGSHFGRIAPFSKASSDLRALHQACQSWGIPFGVVIIGQDNPQTDQQYCDTALAWAQDVRDLLGGWPERLIVESWVERPGSKTLDFPHNLPESQPHTHAALLRVIGELVQA